MKSLNSGDLDYFCERCGQGWSYDLVGGMPSQMVGGKVAVAEIFRKFREKHGLILFIWDEVGL